MHFDSRSKYELFFRESHIPDGVRTSIMNTASMYLNRRDNTAFSLTFHRRRSTCRTLSLVPSSGWGFCAISSGELLVILEKVVLFEEGALSSTMRSKVEGMEKGEIPGVDLQFKKEK